MKIYLAGYFKPPITLFTDAIPILGGDWSYAYRDADVSPYVPTGTRSVLIYAYNPFSSGLDYCFVREKGSGDSVQRMVRQTGCLGTVMGIDKNGVCQACRVGVYLIGYGGKP
jgi:hypothetical protein